MTIRIGMSKMADGDKFELAQENVRVDGKTLEQAWAQALLD